MADQRLPRSRRIGRSREIEAVFRQGRAYSNGILRVHVRGTGAPRRRLAVSVGRRVGSSVQRNRWKRLIREAFRLNLERLPQGIDLVVVPLVPPGALRRQDVERSLLALLERL